MPVSPSDFLTLAKSLSERDSEIEWRSAVSRAYYATYHQLLDFPDRFDMFGEPGQGSHDQLFKTLRAAKCRGGKSNAIKGKLMVLGNDMLQFKQQRTLADYTLPGTITKSDAQMAVETAESVGATAAEALKLLQEQCD